MSVQEPEPFGGDGKGGQARELLVGYAQSVDVLADQAAEDEREDIAVHSAIASGEAVRPPARWREMHPEAFEELKRSYAVVGHSAVLMVLSLSLIGTALTVGQLHLAGWLEAVVRLVASLGAVGCGTVALWRLVRALWRALRALHWARPGGPSVSAAGTSRPA